MDTTHLQYNYCDTNAAANAREGGGGGGHFAYERVRMLVGKFELNP